MSYFSILIEGIYYIDSYHPLVEFNKEEYLSTYTQRYKLMEQFQKSLFEPRLIGPHKIKVHDKLLLAEMEFIRRNINPRFKYPVQYSYIAANHPWDNFIKNIIECPQLVDYAILD
jgi:hypothetical protein